MGDLEKILFICVYNSARSQMAEGLCKHILSHQFEAFSAGSLPSNRVHPMAIAAMGEVGIDISRNKPKSIDNFNLEDFDIIVTLCAEEECPLLPPKVKKLAWNLPDPSSNHAETPEDVLRRFRKTRDDIKRRLQGLTQTQSW